MSLVVVSLIIALAASGSAAAQEPEGWITTYHGGTGDGRESPVGIALGAEGSVYVSGNSGRGATTLKYDVEGKLLWSRQLEGEYATAMALDSAGSLVLGQRVDDGAVIVKYASDGTETGMVRVDGELRSIDVDASDRLFVVSADWQGGFRTTKYDPGLVRQWFKTHRAAFDGWIETLFLRVDDEGSAYVAGSIEVCDPNGCRRGYAAVKYDAAGRSLWSLRDVPVHESFQVAGTTLDESQSLVVVGNVEVCDATGFAAGYALVKYDPEGNVLWSTCYDPPAQGRVRAVAVATDSAGNVYVTGASCGAPGCYTTVKYDPDGALLWEVELAGGSPVAMTVDPGGSVMITGTEQLCQGQDCQSVYMTVKYASDGTRLWVSRFEAPRAGDSYPRVLTVDSSGGVYVAGTASRDYGVVRYEADGSEAWRAFYNTPVEREDVPVGIEVDQDAHLYVAGNSCDPEGCDWATLKYDPDGDVVWERRLEDENATAMALDEDRNVYVTGTLTVKYGGAGEALWEARADDIYPTAVDVDSEGNVYIAGNGRGGRAVVKYDSDGTELWSARSANSSFTTLEVDPVGYVYVAESGQQGRFIVLLDHDGDEIWRAAYGDPRRQSEILDLALDSSGRIHATGHVQNCNPSCQQDVVTVKYDHDGEEVWSVRIPGEDLRPTKAALRVDSDGSVYLSLGACARESCELITARYGADGTETWLRRRAGLEIASDGYYYYPPRPGNITLDRLGGVYVHGIASATVKYDSEGNESWDLELPGVVGSSLALGPEGVHIVGCLRDDYVVITDIPDAFHLEPGMGQAPLDVTVRAPELTTPTGAGATVHDWDFGDEGKATGSSASHTYEHPGSFDLELVSSNELITTRKIRHVDVPCPGGNVAPWISADVGWTGLTGGARIDGVDGSALRICTAGVDIRGTKDGFHFVYQEASGDVLLTARVAALTVGERARVGVMLRESLDPASRHAFMLLDRQTTGTRWRFLYRVETARRSRNSLGESVEVPDAWVRIRRQRDELIGSSSADGVEWIELGRIALDLPETIFVGLAASTRANPPRPPVDAISVSFDHLELALDPAPLDRPFERGDASADGAVNLTDATAILGALFGGRAGAVTCEKSADSNDNGTLEIADAVYLLAHLFRAGPPPAAPFGACGVDPTADALTCVAHAACE